MRTFSNVSIALLIALLVFVPAVQGVQYSDPRSRCGFAGEVGLDYCCPAEAPICCDPGALSGSLFSTACCPANNPECCVPPQCNLTADQIPKCSLGYEPFCDERTCKCTCKIIVPPPTRCTAEYAYAKPSSTTVEIGFLPYGFDTGSRFTVRGGILGSSAEQFTMTQSGDSFFFENLMPCTTYWYEISTDQKICGSDSNSREITSPLHDGLLLR